MFRWFTLDAKSGMAELFCTSWKASPNKQLTSVILYIKGED